MDELTAVEHKACGEIVGHIKDTAMPRSVSSNFLLLSGESPAFGSKIRILCSTCGKIITNLSELKIRGELNG